MASSLYRSACGLVMGTAIAWAVIQIAVLGDYAVNQDQYRFGTEVFSWRYGTPTRYVSTASIELGGALAAAALAGRARRGRKEFLIAAVLLGAAIIASAALL